MSQVIDQHLVGGWTALDNSEDWNKIGAAAKALKDYLTAKARNNDDMDWYDTIERWYEQRRQPAERPSFGRRVDRLG